MSQRGLTMDSGTFDGLQQQLSIFVKEMLPKRLLFNS